MYYSTRELGGTDDDDQDEIKANERLITGGSEAAVVERLLAGLECDDEAPDASEPEKVSATTETDIGDDAPVETETKVAKLDPKRKAVLDALLDGPLKRRSIAKMKNWRKKLGLPEDYPLPDDFHDRHQQNQHVRQRCVYLGTRDAAHLRRAKDRAAWRKERGITEPGPDERTADDVANLRARKRRNTKDSRARRRAAVSAARPEPTESAADRKRRLARERKRRERER